jgi:hypothetical protein
MATNSEFITSIEALLAVAKTYNIEEPDRLTRVKMLSMLEDLHYQLEVSEMFCNNV